MIKYRVIKKTSIHGTDGFFAEILFNWPAVNSLDEHRSLSPGQARPLARDEFYLRKQMIEKDKKTSGEWI